MVRKIMTMLCDTLRPGSENGGRVLLIQWYYNDTTVIPSITQCYYNFAPLVSPRHHAESNLAQQCYLYHSIIPGIRVSYIPAYGCTRTKIIKWVFLVPTPLRHVSTILPQHRFYPLLCPSSPSNIENSSRLSSPSNNMQNNYLRSEVRENGWKAWDTTYA